MFGLRSLARSGLVVAVLFGLIAGAMTPSARADTDLILGGTARIAYANGDPVRLREAPGADAAEITSIQDGTQVSVIDGPIAAGDGSLWYYVSVDGFVGFITEAFLANDAAAPAVETETEPDVVNEAPLVTGGRPATIMGTNGDGARCRVAPNADAPINATLAEGSAIEVAGDPADSWVPVYCEGQPGFISQQFVAIDGVVTVPTEEVVEAPVEVVTEAPTEEIVETEVPAEEGTEAPTEEIITEEPTEEPTEEVVAEEPTEEITEEATEAPTDEATEEPTEEVVTEEPTDEATEEPTEEVATEEPTDEATEEPTEEVTEEATETPTEDASETETPDATEETATPTEEVVETVTPTETTTPTPETIAGEEPVTPSLGTPVLSGTAIVTGSNNGVNCRTQPSLSAKVITVVPERGVVNTRGAAADGWVPVVCNDADGFIASEFLLLDRLGANPTSGDSGGSTLASGKAIISGTNGDGLRCRSKGSTSGSIITVLREGSSVTLRSGSSGSWQAVTCSGMNGFVSNEYLTYGGSTAAGSLVTEASTSSVTGTATVSGTNGDGLRCRAKGSYDAAVISVLKEGSTVQLRGAATKSGWQRVYCGSTAGYVVGEFLSNVSQASNGGTSGGGTTTGASESTAKSASVTGTGGMGVRLRAKASTSSAIVAVVPEGATVKIRTGSTGSWTAVTYNGSNGFIHKDYLKVSTSSSPSTGASNPTATPTSSSGALAKGDRAKTTANLNLRYSASSSAGIAAVAPSGTVVAITGSLKSGFYPVDWDGLAGYMSADYLTKTSAALSTRGGSSGNNSGGTSGGGTTTGGGTSGGGTSAGGDASIVNYAMQYIGYPYVWATAGPSSFDCSGFTYWVIKNTLGMDIGRGLFTQAALGTPINRNSLQPGDLVFFQNTYTWGLSHVGIYIGNDQFVHAQNESTGVVVSDLNSSYYASRWYGAVRL